MNSDDEDDVEVISGGPRRPARPRQRQGKPTMFRNGPPIVVFVVGSDLDAAQPRLANLISNQDRPRIFFYEWLPSMVLGCRLRMRYESHTVAH